MKNLIFLFFIITSINVSAQAYIIKSTPPSQLYGIGKGSAQVFDSRPYCNTLLNNVKNYGTEKAAISEQTLNSTWIKYAQIFVYESTAYVIVKLKYKEYIYCDVSVDDWQSFMKDSGYSSYGDRYHAYIKRNTCDCK